LSYTEGVVTAWGSAIRLVRRIGYGFLPSQLTGSGMKTGPESMMLPSAPFTGPESRVSPPLEALLPLVLTGES